MDENPNVNNLNGVPNFGHGLPEETPMEEVTEAPVEETTAEEVAPEAPVEEAPVELPETNQE